MSHASLICVSTASAMTISDSAQTGCAVTSQTWMLSIRCMTQCIKTSHRLVERRTTPMRQGNAEKTLLYRGSDIGNLQRPFCFQKGNGLSVKGRTHSPLAIKQAIKGNHWHHGSYEAHDSSWHIHQRVAHKQKKYGIG